MVIRKIVWRAMVAGALGCGVIGLTAAAPAADGPVGFGGPSAGLRVPAKGADTHSFTFRKGQKVTIKVTGDGDTDIDLYVYDENGRLVAKDDDTTDICVVQFTPEETQRYQVKITNLGNVYNEYKMEIK
jgi:hypothetical protein